MPEERRTVFISCGQHTDEEKDLGDQVSRLVDEITPFRGYFAKNEVTLRGLSDNILKQLYGSVGLIAIMHYRGIVEATPPGNNFNRASVWIEQEIAISALMAQVLNRRLHVALFIQRGIALEGIRTQLQLNPIEFSNGESVIAELRCVLPKWKEPYFLGDDERKTRLDAVDLSAKVVQGYSNAVSIEIKSHCKEEIEIESIVLSSNGKRLCDPVYPPSNARWTLHANGYLPIWCNPNEDIALRLIGINAKTPEMLAARSLDSSSHFPADITIEMRCEILGMKRTLPAICSVEVNLRSRQMNGL